MKEEYNNLLCKIGHSHFSEKSIILIILFSSFLVYAPILDNYFSMDDFLYLSFARENGLALKSFFTPERCHIPVIARFLFVLQFKLFGTNPFPYHLVSVSLHLLSIFLCINFFSKLTSRKDIGLLSGLLFALSASHCNTVMWIILQAQIMTSVWFLICGIYFLKYMETKKLSFLFLSFFFHLLMLFSFTSGFSVPLLFISLYFIFYSFQENRYQKIRKGFFIVIPFIANIVLFFVLNTILLSGQDTLIGNMGGLSGFLVNLPQAVWYLMGGIWYGYVRTFMGIFVRNAWGNIFAYIIVLSIFVLSFSGLKKNKKLIFWLIAGLVLTYFPSAIPRKSCYRDYFWFVTRFRYRYLPCVFASALVSTVFFNLRLPKKRLLKNIFCLLLFIASGFVITQNYYAIRKRESYMHNQSRNLEIFLKKFLDNLNGFLLSKDTVYIINQAFFDENSRSYRFCGYAYAGWYVHPSQVCSMYLSDDNFSRIIFLEEDNWQKFIHESVTVYRIQPITGNLIPAVKH
ncbi:MAG: hypothetical protein ABIG31_05260 [Candidatus Omnitrophota bacterium]